MSDQLDRLTTALADRYTIERELGAGGMATVYLAEDLKHHRHVAVKVLRPELAAVIGGARFLKEIEVTANLQHPNILPLYDSGEANTFLYYVMPFIEGESLRDRLNQNTQLSVDECLDIARGVGRALDYAHRHGVVHRDLKPENILLQEGVPLVADFGIALAVSAAGDERLTQTGMAIGTPAYMSPEQAGGERELGSASDIYALACVVYELLVGEPPFTGPTAQAVIAKHIVDPVPSPRRLRSSIPAAVDRAIQKAMEKAPTDRFPSTGEFIAAFDAPVPELDARERSIAVLPFANVSPDPENEFFTDGITEEIINVLNQIDGLQVAARTSCFAFKGKHDDLRAVGDRLGVQTVLEGSVRRAGQRLRVTAQLVNAADGLQLWSERYDREMTDVFAIQDEIASGIAEKLQVTLAMSAPGRSARPGHTNLEAYELFLKGRVLLLRRGPSIVESIGCFERAVEMDPDLVEAQAGLADAHRLLAIYGIKPAHELMPKARAAAEQALRRDPKQVEALATLANVVAVYDYDLDASVALTDRVLAVDPNNVRALCERAICVGALSEDPEARQRAMDDAHRGTELDPLNAWAAGIYAFVLGFGERYEDAVDTARHAVEVDPQNFMARWSLVEATALARRYEEALAATEPALVMSGRHPYALTALAGIHWARDDREAAEAVYEELVSRARSGYVGETWMASASAAAGRIDEARAHAQRGVEGRETWALYWKRTLDWAAFREDSVGVEIMKASGLS